MLAPSFDWRRVAAVTAVAAAQVAAPLVPLGPAFAQMSMDCTATVPGVTARGMPTTLRYDDGRTSSLKRGPDALGYQPRDIALPHRTTTSKRSARLARQLVTTKRSYWFTLSGQQLREVTEIDRYDGAGRLLSADYRTRVMRRGWSGVRQMSIGQGRKYLYVLDNNDQLLRYRFSGKAGNASVAFDRKIGTGFGTLGTFQYVRTVTILGSAHDVFLATDADSGELLEYTIPVSSPTSYIRTVLMEGGWADMRSAGRTASCVDSVGTKYAGIVAVDIFGSVRLWSDRHGADGNGDDIVDRGVIKTDWRPLAYNN